MKYGKIAKRALAGILALMLIGCQSPQKDTDIVTEEAVEELDIFLVGDKVQEYYASEDRESAYYTTMMTLGEKAGLTSVFGEEGFVFYDAFKAYEAQTGTHLQLHWFDYPENMEEELEKLPEEELPDLILSNMTSKADYTAYMKSDMFYDVSEYAEDEGLYTEGKYYNSVLNAGKYLNKQYILPIMFNIDTVMGSEENALRYNLPVKDAQSHAEVVDILTNELKKGEAEDPVCQYVAGISYYTPYMLYAASGEQWIDYETNQASLDQNRFNQMAVFCKSYLEDQLGRELVEGEQIPWADTKILSNMRAINNMIVDLDWFLEGTGCIIEGGGSFQTHLHSAPAQARYYESWYSDMGQEFFVAPIPSQNGKVTAYAAYFGGVLKGTEHPQAAYQFLRYLMDSEWFFHIGMSVNIENNKKQLADLASSEYTIYPGLQQTDAEGNIFGENMSYTAHPLSEKTKEKFLTMLENMEPASLPNWPVYDLIRTQLESYSKGEVDLEEAYQKVLESLNAYAREMQ